jgi:predicted HTH transcriptional regulator
VSATEREYDAAVSAGVECWVYLSNVEKRDKKTEALVKKVGSAATWAKYEGFPELRDAVFSSFVDFLDKRHLLVVSDFDVMACPQARMEDISTERVSWYLEMLHRHGKKSLPLDASPQKLLKHLGMLKGKYLTNAGVLLFGTKPQDFYYQTTLKCAWVEGTVYTRPFLDTAKFEGDLFALLEQGRNFVMSRIAHSRGLRTDGPIAPSLPEIPEEAAEEAIVNALIHRNWHSSASVEIRLFADRLEVWSPGHLPPDITIPELYKEHDSHPVNKEILKAFDKINVIESLGTGIERMIAACHASGLPTPVFEYHGSAFVVTILKDAWTRTALESLDLNPDQIKAVSYVKVNGWISSSRYAELYKVPMRTSSRELGELAHKGVFVLVGKGRQSRYELKSNRARIAPIAPNAEQSANPLKIKGKSKVDLGLSPQTSREAAQEAAQETAQENLSAEESIIVDCIKANTAITRKLLSEKLGISSDSVKRRLEALKAKLGLHHEGPTKKGRWVFGPEPKGKRGAK